ncbi:sensor histidine kinase [Limimaricola soesokkakensis]|uniref:sensor histidine kinase n=1 Tax=Limimaricola soesokkakensis TaxID=1343159 RepID=UPI00351640CA
MLDTVIQSGRALLHAIPVPAIVMSNDLEILDVNAPFTSAVARERGSMIGKQLFAEFPGRADRPNLESAIRASVARAVVTKLTDALAPGQHDITMPDGSFETRYWRLSHSPVIENDEVVCILQLVEDVTKEVTGEMLQKIRERTASEGAALSFCDLNLVTGELVRSAAVDALHGFAPGEAGDNIETFLERVHPEDRARVRTEIFSALERGTGPTHLEHRLLLPDGTVRWISAHGEILIGPVNGEPHLVGMVVDVTDFHRKEEELKAALAGQKLLLNEVNHRVKNSLQMVASLLNLESRRAAAEAQKDLLSASARVNAIATIHTSLYDQGDVTSVAVDSQLRDLCDHLAASAGGDARKIEIMLDVAPIRLCADKAISLSIIVNELISNALRHAFHGRESGHVFVRLEADDVANELILTVRDNGKGLGSPAAGPTSKASGLGQRLVQMSARQIGGQVEQIASDAGWATILRFPAQG